MTPLCFAATILSLLLGCAHSSPSDTQYDLIGALAQGWRLNITMGARDTSTITSLQLQRGVHFAEALSGVLTWPSSAEDSSSGGTAVQQPYVVRFTPNRRNNSALFTAWRDGGDTSSEDYDDQRFFAKVTVRPSRGGWIAMGAFTAPKGHLSDDAVSGTFTLLITSPTTAHLSIEWDGGWAFIAAAGDKALPEIDFWLRWGPSLGMFVIFIVMRLFSSFIEEKQEQKAIKRAYVAKRHASSARDMHPPKASRDNMKGKR